jgi:hypothetical protein
MLARRRMTVSSICPSASKSGLPKVGFSKTSVIHFKLTHAEFLLWVSLLLLGQLREPDFHRPNSRVPIGLSGVLRTTPWMACGPKCLVAASPPNTIVMFEFATVYGTPVPPVMQT